MKALVLDAEAVNRLASARSGAKILTGDVTDLAKLSAGMVGISVESV
jgi:hypothetical protein